MPPEVKPLSAAQVEALRRWIDGGALSPLWHVDETNGASVACRSLGICPCSKPAAGARSGGSGVGAGIRD